MLAERNREPIGKRIAVDLEATTPVSFDGLESGDLIRVALFSLPLSTLHIAAGPIPDDSTGERTIAPFALGAVTGTVTERSLGWSELESPPRELDLTLSAGCPTISVRTLPLAFTGAIVFLAPYDGQAIVGTASAGLYRATSDAVLPYVAPFSGTDKVNAGFSDATGTLWIATVGNQLFRLPPGSQTVELVPTTTQAVEPRWVFSMTGGPTGGATELFFATTLAGSSSVAYLEHVDLSNGRRSDVFSTSVPRSDLATVLWFSPGEALYCDRSIWHAGPSGSQNLPLTGRSLACRGLTRTASGTIFATAEDLTATSTARSLFRLDPGAQTWTRVGALRLTSAVGSQTALSNGLLYASHKGAVAYYDPILGFCPQEEIVGTDTPLDLIAAVDETHALAASHYYPETHGVHWLTLSW
jgi:hypothetical protein